MANAKEDQEKRAPEVKKEVKKREGQRRNTRPRVKKENKGEVKRQEKAQENKQEKTKENIERNKRKTGRKPRKNTRMSEEVRIKKSPLKIIPLGGLLEIGKNITVFEYENEIIIVDCGLAFPTEDMLGERKTISL